MVVDMVKEWAEKRVEWKSLLVVAEPRSSIAFAYGCSYHVACELELVELPVIDEISTCGAEALEVLCRRMQQVACDLWRRLRSTPAGDKRELDVRDACHRVRRGRCQIHGARWEASV